jgi:mannonate dehydratase
MRQTWRWFGPADLASIDDIVQAGAEGVVTALHHVPNGLVWSAEEIGKRQQQIRVKNDGSPSGIAWDVIESLPVSEDIKKQKGDWREHIANYKQSLRHVAAAGLRTVCYNFMPVLDWTRTDLRYQVAHGGTCMRFDINDFAAFDIHILKRPGASEDFSPEVVSEAGRRIAMLDGAAGLDREHDARRCPRPPRRIRPHLGRSAAPAFHRFPQRSRAGGRRGWRPPLLPPGRSAVLAARPAAHHVDGR